VTAESVMASEALGLAQHEQDLVETLVLDHSRLVYRIACSVLRNETDAEDATQETFLRALRYRKKLARIQDPKAWLARIAWRVAVERHENKIRAADADPPDDTLVSPVAGADRLLLEEERGALLDRLLSALPEELRDPLVLLTLEEMSPREVGLVLDISEAAVRSRAFRARQILRERLLALTSPRK